MNEQQRADEFCRNLDGLLSAAPGQPREAAIDEPGELAFARQFLAHDFSSAKIALRQRLRRQLQGQPGVSADGKGHHVCRGQRPAIWPHPLMGARRTALTCVSVLALVMASLLTVLAYPPARAAAQDAWQTLLRSVQLVRTLPQPADSASPGVTIAVKSPAEAAPLVPFPLAAPAHLPSHYEFRYGWVRPAPVPSASFSYGIPFGRIVTLPDGQAVNSRTYQGLLLTQSQTSLRQEWPIGRATVEDTTVGGRPALWLTGLPLVQMQSKVSVSAQVTDGEIVREQVLSQQDDPAQVRERTPSTILAWEDGGTTVSLLDLDGRFDRAEMIRIAESMVPVSALAQVAAPDLAPAETATVTYDVAGLEALTAEAAFAPYAFASPPPGWQMQRITGFSRSDSPLERWYLIQYGDAQGASISLIEGLMVPLEQWPNYVGSDGVRRHVAGNGLEVWTSAAYQQNRERMAVENARANNRPAPDEVHAVFVRSPDGFSLQLIATNITWHETLAFVERLDLTPGADPALNTRLVKGCGTCP